ncbi:MAG: hypothetical protein PHQ81_02800 [Methanofollis sp.]|nr:hypothetical protein [Methanofollis sp.]
MSIVSGVLRSAMVWKVLFQIDVLQKRYSSIVGKRGLVEILFMSLSLSGEGGVPSPNPPRHDKVEDGSAPG